MGNSQAINVTTNSENNLLDFILKIDTYAANYITNQDVRTSTRMADLNYCDDLIIMTSNTISEKLSSIEIDYLSQRTEKGNVIDKMDSEKLIYLNKNDLNNLDVENKTKKRRLCIGIAKFYVKIGQLYSAIMKTVNPVYIYKDSNNRTVEYTLEDKRNKKLSPNYQYSSMQINFCNTRLNALLNGENLLDNNLSNDSEVTIRPDVCRLNIKNGKQMTSIAEETGMLEFEKLFYDVYNYDLGIFDSMSDSMKVEYNKALKEFYKAYTNDKSPMPDNIKRFRDIPLRAFHNYPNCKNDSGLYNNSYRGKLSDSLFSKYAMHLKEMYKKTETKNKELLDILKQVFSIIKNSNTNNQSVIINPSLNYPKLEELIKKSKDMILKMYTDCEVDFYKGFEILQEIIVNQKNNQMESQLSNLKKTVIYTEPQSYTDEQSYTQPQNYVQEQVYVEPDNYVENSRYLEPVVNYDENSYEYLYNEKRKELNDLKYQKALIESKKEIDDLKRQIRFDEYYNNDNKKNKLGVPPDRMTV